MDKRRIDRHLWSMRWLLVLLLAWPAYAGSGDLLVGTAIIVDGDTLDLRTKTRTVRIRIASVNAPERGRPGARAASRYLWSLTAGKQVYCLDTGDRTPGIKNGRRIKRVVATCFVQRRPTVPWQDLAILLRRGGHAREIKRYSNGYYR